ncbi:hypothetical protein BLA9940_07057 [Burkholderia aenigmatica]|nr:hypothetical protein BLA9940_07057 [Burkholderia aenigmatica]
MPVSASVIDANLASSVRAIGADDAVSSSSSITAGDMFGLASMMMVWLFCSLYWRTASVLPTPTKPVNTPKLRYFRARSHTTFASCDTLVWTCGIVLIVARPVYVDSASDIMRSHFVGSVVYLPFSTVDMVPTLTRDRRESHERVFPISASCATMAAASARFASL